MSDNGDVFVLTTEEKEMVEFLRKLGLSECLKDGNNVEEFQDSKCFFYIDNFNFSINSFTFFLKIEVKKRERDEDDDCAMLEKRRKQY
jgi:hypothetical protein